MAKKAAGSKLISSPEPPRRSRRVLRYALTLLLTGVLALAWLSLLSFDATDPPSHDEYPARDPVNQVGIVGAYVAYGLRLWVGIGAYVALGVLSLFSVLWLLGRRVTDVVWRLVGLVLLIASVSTAAFLRNPTFALDPERHSAGRLGMTIGDFLGDKFGSSGSWLMLAMTAAIGLLLVADEWIKAGFVRVGRLWKRRGEMAEKFAELRAQRQADRAEASTVATAAASEAARPRPPVPEPPRRPSRPTSPTAETEPDSNARPDRPQSPARRAKPPKEKRERPQKPAKKTVRPTPHALPSTELLAVPKGGYLEVAVVQAAQRKLVLQQTLDDFNVQAKVEGYMTGPVITLFEVSLAPGVKVAQVANLATDIARALAVPGVRIVPPRFGKETIGIEVPNLDKETVRILELMEMAPEAPKKMLLPMYLGKDAGGDAITVDLATCPHMLIAGTTGSGKSVCINTIIMSILMHRTPAEVRFILIDPKMVEMAAYENLPHLLCPTINDMRKAEEILEWAVIKMDERYEVLKEARVKDLREYNKLKPEELYRLFGAEDAEQKAAIPLKIPAVVIIVDELADLMMTSTKEVEGYIIRIAQKARAVGIHLVLATQRPSANVVTGLIKSNMPCRISFRVASGQESRIVLDSKGAEVLLGQGDMLLLQPGTSNLVRAQGTFVDDSEICAIVDQLSGGEEPTFDEELVALQSRSGDGFSGEKDEMFNQAVEVVLSTKRGSVSLLQRRLSIGYGRASRIIDQMAESGILGDHKGSQARECMISIDDWEAMKAGIAADRSGANSLNGEGTSA